MQLDQFDPNFGLLRSLSTIELEKTNNPDLESSVWDYVNHGVKSSAVSAVVGVLNTGVALGEAFNLADEDSYFDEEAAVMKTFGAETADFYARHKTGADVAGMVVSSFIPGMAGVRLLRAAQVAGKLPWTMAAQTGLKNSDIVLGSRAVQAAKESAMLTGKTGLANPQIRRAYAQGVGQQFLEAAAFDMAFIATMNQNSALNPDDLGFFESSKNLMFESVPFVIAGGAIGGGVDILRIRGAVRKNMEEEFIRTAKYAAPMMEGMTGYTPGERFIALAEHLSERVNLLKELDPNDLNAVRSFEAGQSVLKKHLSTALADLGAQDAFVTETLSEVVLASERGESIENIAAILSGVTSAKRVSAADAGTQTSFYNRSAATPKVIEGEGPETVQQYNRFIEALGQELETRFGPEVRANFHDKLVRGQQLLPGTSGQATISPQGSASKVLRDAEDQGILTLAYGVDRDGKGVFALPRIVELDSADIQSTFDLLSNAAKKTGMELPYKDVEEYRQFVFLHELGHVRTNNSKSMMMLEKARLSGNMGTVTQLLQASASARPEHWKHAFGTKTSDQAVEKYLDIMENEGFQGLTKSQIYLESTPEILADAAAYFTSEASRQQASKRFPLVAKFLNSQGSIAKPWKDTEAFYNARTGKVSPSALVGLQDVIKKKQKFKAKKDGINLFVPELEKTFKYSNTGTGKMFRDVFDLARKGKLDYMDYDAQWHIVDNLELKQLVDLDKPIVTADGYNLPLLEKLAAQWKNAASPAEVKFFDQLQEIDLGGEFISITDLQGLTSHIKNTKEELRMLLSTQELGGQTNNNFLEKILNIDEDASLGLASGKDMLYGIKNFRRPELIKMAYKHRTPEDYQGAAISYAASNHRRAIQEEVRQQASAQVLRQNYDKLQDAPAHAIPWINPGESRAGLLGAARPEFGSFREFAAQVGKLVNKNKIEIVNDVNKDFQAAHSKFNQRDNVKIRQELVMADNLARRSWFYPVKYTSQTGETKYAMVNKTIAEMEELDPSMLRELADEEVFVGLSSYKNGNRAADSDFVDLSPEVGEFLLEQVRRNASIVRDKETIAKAKGRFSALDPNVIYPPPRDLSKERYFAFVRPTDAMRGSDPRNYMIFAQSEGEYNAKLATIREKYGDNYRVVTKSEREDYAKLRGEYDKDLVFDEIHFDSSLAREGRASELVPNLDLESSSTLDRYRTWTIRQRESILKAGVELRYDAEIQNIRALDRHYSETGRNRLDKKYREEDSIWKDSVGLMLDEKSYGGPIEDKFVQINDFAGEYGSKIMDTALSILRPGRNKGQITDKELELYNKQLEDAGIHSPTRSAIEAIATSPNITKGRSFNNMVRTISNLTGTFMLRLDPAHSWMQIISTPILGLPVLKELQQTLKGTERGKALRNLTSVVQPATGMAEPSVAKLWAEGTKAFFTDEGKAFMQQLKDRNIISDHLAQYLDVLDFSAFDGTHKISALQKKMDQMTKFGSKWSGHIHAEQLSRFQVAWATKRIAEVGGLAEEAMFPLINSAIDKVHGVYLGTQRTQLFQGVVGQTIGLFQTYFFNYMQNIMKFIENGNRKSFAITAGMQTSLFGIQSLPGFKQLNQMIGETNSGNLDLYNVTTADDPNSKAAYFMYGLGSHSLGFPIDFYSRGDLAIRHSTIVPTNFRDFPAVNIISNSVGNLLRMFDDVADEGVPVKEALLHGLAHNGFNRPLQGLGTILQNSVTSRQGVVNYSNPNYLDPAMAQDVSFGSMFARLIGARPLDESITTNAYYREVGYKANQRKKLEDVGRQVRLNLRSGKVEEQTYGTFLEKYEEAGGDVQSFNAYWSRQLQQVSAGEMEEFRREMETNKAYQRMLIQQSTVKPWELTLPYSDASGSQGIVE